MSDLIKGLNELLKTGFSPENYRRLVDYILESEADRDGYDPRERSPQNEAMIIFKTEYGKIHLGHYYKNPDLGDEYGIFVDKGSGFWWDTREILCWWPLSPEIKDEERNLF